MALAGALASCGLVVGGFSNQTLRPAAGGAAGCDLGVEDREALPVRQALRTLDRAVTDYVSEARMTA